MTNEQAELLRKARDTMPERLIADFLYRDSSDRYPGMIHDNDNGVCAVGHLCVFADIPIEWIDDCRSLNAEAVDALTEFYGFSLEDSFGRIAPANDLAIPEARRAVAIRNIDVILMEYGHEPYPPQEGAA